ncbi:TetR/AcrR family transcriptional regulator C-terminal domain-containing protein [Actinokineospora soli]|uniref:TetR/AcrR family transcriptional regulator C-terminal domain-containing protein n=1 Tax=Actinokineospora soli TaxID=1048753 RepID=A0ABW2THQ8_9PSEU
MREVLNRHPWAIGLMDSRTNPGWATLRHHDAMIGCFRAAGFTVAGAAHAVSVVDAYLYGFVLQELSLPFKGDEVVDVAGGILDGLPKDEFPHLAELIVEHAMKPGYDYTAEFAIGFDLVLDGLERHRERW